MRTAAQKLGVKDKSTLGLINGDTYEDFPSVTQDLEIETTIVSAVDADVVLIPVSTKDELSRIMTTEISDLKDDAIIWICYRKGNQVELNRDKIRFLIAEYNWRPNSQIALNEAWSALRVRPMTADEITA
ncbi:hypothetical protein [Weissella paramesenteroides]|jgi:hypothetical protein|uniref:hypothetical protein n=1 Tax=Weissella paramesenteroides TaxID=1249 RepID=UPI002E7B1527|nr:hypothetical protein [Weissella paramesenteroides]WPQ67930.1 hypothetical protein QRX23_09330 [Weissella paramesenteroides]